MPAPGSLHRIPRSPAPERRARLPILLAVAAILLLSASGAPPATAARVVPPPAPAADRGGPTAPTVPIPIDRLLPGDSGAPGPLVSDAALARVDPTFGFPLADFLDLPDAPGARSPIAATAAPPPGARPSTGASVGWFVGYTNDSTDRAGLENVTLTATSASICPIDVCVATQSSVDGAFNVTCDALGGIGNDYTIAADGPPWWTNNQSYAVCAAGRATDVGTIYLVRDGVADGIVVDAANGRPVAGVTVSAVSRNGAEAAFPTGLSGSNGAYEMAVPPEPSKVTFSPPVGYLSTFNYTNATPGLGTRPGAPPWTDPVDLGTIVLVPETVVRVDLVDAVTGQPVTAEAQVQVCDGATADCQPVGALQTGGHPTAEALPGPDSLRVDAVGYAETDTEVRTIPAEPPGTPYEFGNLTLTPFAAVTIESSLSEPTGGTYPWTAPSTPVDSIYVVACSLDGFLTPVPSGPNLTSDACAVDACIPLGVPTTVYLPPLRDTVAVGPDVLNYCRLPPLPPAWPVAPNAPAFADDLTLNLTAGHGLTGTVYANLSLGDYVAGNVFVAGTTSAPSGCWEVSFQSTDNAEMATPTPYDAWDSCLDNSSAAFAPCASLLTFSPTAFCAPVPPGDSEIEVSDPGYLTNRTWVHVVDYCCRVPTGAPAYPATLRAATADHEEALNLTSDTGNVSGWAVVGGAANGGSIAAFGLTVCSAFQPTVACGGANGTDGNFSVAGAPAGIDAVSVESPGYASDAVWVDVPAGGSASAGTIPMSPDGTVSGTVDDANGTPILGATISYCPLAESLTCLDGGGVPLGLGISGSDGTFNGTVPGGWLPWATYVVAVTASGYVSDWTYANVSSGAFVTLPPFLLDEVQGNASPLAAAPAGRPAAALPASVWIDGRFLVGSSGTAPDLSETASLQACPLSGGSCTLFPDLINTAGYFNGSVAPGVYDLNLTSTGFAPFSQYVNATSGGAIDLGTLRLVADDWVRGRVAIDPWESVTLSSGGTYGSGYGPFALVTGCNATGGDCQLGLELAQNGSFNVTVPAGTSASVVVQASAGFLPNATTTTLTGSVTTLSGSQSPIRLSIYGVVAGRILDAGSDNASGVPQFGLQDAVGEAIESGNTSVDDQIDTDLQGDWVAFVPSGDGPNHLTVEATDAPGFDGDEERVAKAVAPGAVPVAEFNATLDHYGWVVARLVAAGTGAPVPDAAVTITGRDPGLGVPVGILALSSSAGLLNISAPPGTSDNLTVVAALYNSTAIAVGTVSSGGTTFLNGSGYASLGTTAVAAFGTVRSPALLFADHAPPLGASLPSPAVTDTANGRAVPDASVSVVSSDPSVATGAPSLTNAAGEFDTDAPIGARDPIEVSALAYEPALGSVDVAAGGTVVLDRINLTGDAVVAGTVVDRFGAAPVAGASVMLCTPAAPAGPTCENFTANASGVFWGTVAPGLTTVSASAPDFESNSTMVKTCPDCFVTTGELPLSPYGGVVGVLRGLPEGFLLPGGNVSLCPADLYVGDPCGLSATSGADGSFFLPDAPGSYVLTAVATDYNATSLSVTIAPGEVLPVGTLLLEAYGAAEGTVLDGITGAAVANATVSACATWAGGACAPLATANASGDYVFEGAPGPYGVNFGATGFQTVYEVETLDSGELTQLPDVTLYPEGDNTPITLSGAVVSAADPSQGIRDATVSAEAGGVIEFSTVTAANGSFVLPVAFGSYTVVATAVGETADRISVDADRSIADLLFELGPSRYVVAGNVTDGLTHLPLAGVAIEGPLNATGGNTGPVLATSAANGTFAFALSNGSYTLAAVAPEILGVRYPTVVVSVSISGHAVPEAIVLDPARVALELHVVDAGTGLGITGAAVTLYGTPEPGHPVSATLSTFTGGAASDSLYAASYLVGVSAPGYAPASRVVDLVNASTTVTIALAPVGAAPLGTSVPPTFELGLAAGLALAAAAAIALLLVRRRRAEGPAPERPPEEPPEEYYGLGGGPPD